jgi:alkylation response protein AidB-like acyl-CoA dehydrogenase
MDDPVVQDMVGEAHMLEVVGDELLKRVSDIMVSGRRTDQVAAVGRLFKGVSVNRIATLAFEVAGADGAAWPQDATGAMAAVNFLMRQGGSIGGGTTEMARNVIAERVLGMPRERTLDRDVPFRDVPRSRPSGT